MLVLCAAEHQLPASYYPGVGVVYAPMDDGEVVPTEVASRAARIAARAHRLGATILVVCHEGLVSALVLREMSGRSGKVCADRIRAKRPGALTNPHFAAWLHGLPAEE